MRQRVRADRLTPHPTHRLSCPRTGECSRTATSTAPRAYGICPHFLPSPHDPHLSVRLLPYAPARALHIPSAP
jgi:hypothetical protein